MVISDVVEGLSLDSGPDIADNSVDWFSAWSEFLSLLDVFIVANDLEILWSQTLQSVLCNFLLESNALWVVHQQREPMLQVWSLEDCTDLVTILNLGKDGVHNMALPFPVVAWECNVHGEGIQEGVQSKVPVLVDAGRGKACKVVLAWNKCLIGQQNVEDFSAFTNG